MNALALVLIILAILFILPGLLIQAVKVLLWIGIALAVVAFIVWAINYIRSGTRD